MPLSSKSTLANKLTKDDSLNVRILCRYIPLVSTDIDCETAIKFVNYHEYTQVDGCVKVCKFPVGLYKSSETYPAYINLADMDGASNYICSVDVTMVEQITEIVEGYNVIVIHILCEDGFILTRQVSAERASKYPSYTLLCKNFLREHELFKSGAYSKVDYTLRVTQGFESIYFDLHMLLFNSCREGRIKCL